ncbi:HNH endonuclease signature motif containing protein [Streptosporangium pseudovulgare]|uniref:HNH nuclease domain-containing protein n=1 Tax=Streptosporangium pseudovulgare TaxID=35765 RepID=A0ABQ2RDG7_9ACTN|nr:HNH endonuclease signature motif containing protein [Streptosporangium pseudovulgare]GGQ23578.1 hypothetical protein GCM10010140_62320 [Streptosporangium pseudovulgare]
MSDRAHHLAKASERFWSKVERKTKEECWLWMGARRQKGYGRFRVEANGHGYAHRFAYELLVDEIPEGMTIDHLCRVPSCVNPAHMEVITASENALRAARSRGVSVSPSALIERLQALYDAGVRDFATRDMKALWESNGLSRQWAQKHLKRLIEAEALGYSGEQQRYLLTKRPAVA